MTAMALLEITDTKDLLRKAKNGDSIWRYLNDTSEERVEINDQDRDAIQASLVIKMMNLSKKCFQT
jgi:hypothetical protein